VDALSRDIVDTQDPDPVRRHQVSLTAQRVAALGEPVRTVLTPEAAGELLAATGWRAAGDAAPDPHLERSTRAGFLLAQPA